MQHHYSPNGNITHAIMSNKLQWVQPGVLEWAYSLKQFLHFCSIVARVMLEGTSGSIVQSPVQADHSS